MTAGPAADATPAEATSLLDDEVADDLRSSVRRLLEDRADWSSVLARTESEEPTDLGLWAALTDIGLPGLLISEQRGGAGASAREVAVVLEELGRAVAPVPFLASAVLATVALQQAGGPVAEQALGRIADGDIATLGVDASSSPWTPPKGVRASGGRLTGEVRNVIAGGIAALVVVPADGALYLVDPAAGGAGGTVARAPVVGLDLTRPMADLRFDGTPAERVTDAGTPAVAAALRAGAALLASEQLGVADRCLAVTLDYLKVRHQFGRPIGSFQALKHRVADLWTEAAQARAAARYAAVTLAAGDPDTDIAAAVAAAYCGDAAVHAAEECVQLHGGIGFTWEHPAHLFLKRAKSAQLILGTPGAHRAALAELADLPPA
jgi:alkylation response protein AidB-like acyl-CoA dehydrogenase